MHKKPFIFKILFLLLSVNTHTALPFINTSNLKNCGTAWEDPMLRPVLLQLQLASPPSVGPAPADTTYAQAAVAILETTERHTPSPPPTQAPRKQDKKARKRSKGSGREKQQYFCTYPDCDKSDYNWSTKYKWDRHTRTHTKEKPFGCDVCGFRAGQKEVIKTHLTIADPNHRAKVERRIRTIKHLSKNANVSKYLQDKKFLAQFVLDLRKQQT